jgi:hypothetical protein
MQSEGKHSCCLRQSALVSRKAIVGSSTKVSQTVDRSILPHQNLSYPRKAFLPDSTPSTFRIFRMFQGDKQHLNNVRLLKNHKSLGKHEQAGSLIVSTGRLHSLSSVSHKLFDCKAVTLWAAFTS